MTKQNSAIDRGVAYGLLQVYMGQIVPMRYGNLLIVFVISLYFWNPEQSGVVIGWFLVSLIVSLILSLLVVLYRRNPYRYSPEAWMWFLAPGTFIIGLVWGAIPLLFIDFSDVNLMMIFAMIAMGQMSSSLYTLSLLKPLYYLQMIGVMFPLIYSFYGEDLFLPFIVGAVVLSIILAWFSHFIHRITKENLMARMELDMQAVALKQAREDAEQANRAKTSFLAAASHDLAQPLQAMALYAETLHHRLKEPKNIEIIDSLSSSHAAMSGVMHSLLDISKLDAGIIEANIVTVNLNSMVGRLQREFQIVADKKGIRIRNRVDVIYVRSDLVLLERIIRNLMSNAIRYTDSGSILLATRMRQGEAVFEVWDSGRGIPDEQINHIFLEFHQVTPGNSNHSKGLGLGLAIVRRLLLLLPGHHINVCSRVRSGSRFSLTMPLGDRDACAVYAFEGKEASLAGLKVLLVEDHAAARDALALLMEEWGCVVIQVENASAAGSYVVRGGLPDLMIVDYHLGDGETGVQVIKRMREMLSAQIPALVVTGESLTETLRDIQDAGVLLLHKPILPAKLKLFLKQCYRR